MYKKDIGIETLEAREPNNQKKQRKATVVNTNKRKATLRDGEPEEVYVIHEYIFTHTSSTQNNDRQDDFQISEAAADKNIDAEYLGSEDKIKKPIGYIRQSENKNE